jgi:hypothetical protein
MAGEIKVNLLSGFQDKGVKDAMTALRGLGAGFKNMAKQLVGAYVGFQGFQKGVAFIKDSIDASRNLQRNLEGLKTIFGVNTAEMIKFSEAGVQMGMSTAEAAKATTFIGSVMKQSGFAMEENILFTKQLVSLGADLAATYGYDVQEALTGMTALFRGEYDPIEKFGVAIKQVQVNTYLAEQGLSKLTGTHKLHAQQLARMILLFEATQDVQGAFSRQTNTLAVAQQQLAATFTNLQASIGNNLITPVTYLVMLMRNLTEVIGPSLNNLFIALGVGAVGLGDNAAGAATQISELVDQLTALAKFVIPIFSFFIDIMTSFGASIVLSIVTFKSLKAVITSVGIAFTSLRTILAFFTAQQVAATAAANALAVGETAAGTAAVASGRAIAATPWGAIATAVALLGAGVVLLGGSFIQAMDKAKPAGESIDDFHARIDETGTVSAYGTALFSLSNNFGTLSESAKKAIAATTVWKNLTKADNSDIFTRTGANNRKPSKPGKVATPLTDAQKALADFKKMMEELGLLGGSGGAAGKAAKAMADPFKKLVTSIQDDMRKIQDSIVGAFDITNMGTKGGSISRNIDKFMKKLREFSGYIKTLREKGLAGDLLQQLAMAGPEKGLAAAKAFAGDQSLINQANAAYGELGTTATAIAGNVVQAKAAPVYNINVNAGVGDKKTIGMAVVEAIKSFERTNGKGWRS